MIKVFPFVSATFQLRQSGDAQTAVLSPPDPGDAGERRAKQRAFGDLLTKLFVITVALVGHPVAELAYVDVLYRRGRTLVAAHVEVAVELP